MVERDDVSGDPVGWLVQELSGQPASGRLPTPDCLAEEGFHGITRALHEQLPAIIGEDCLPACFPPSLAAALARCREQIEAAWAASVQVQTLDQDSPCNRALIDSGAHGEAREDAAQDLRDACRDTADSVIALLDEFAAIQREGHPCDETMSDHDWNDICSAVTQGAAAVVCYLSVLSDPEGLQLDALVVLLRGMSLITAAAHAGCFAPLQGGPEAGVAGPRPAAWDESGISHLRSQCEKIRVAAPRP